MKDNIKIEEKDIFNYIFYPDSIMAEQADFIKDNKEYKSIIELYNNIRNDMEKGITSEQKKKIASKISDYRYQRIITLYPVKNKIKPTVSEVPILAAASAKKEPQVKAQTFIDDEKGYVLRLVRIGESSKVYIFPIHKSNKEKLNITLKPSDHNFEIKDLSVPLEINDLPPVDSISIEYI